MEALREANVQIMRSFKYVIEILCISHYQCCVVLCREFDTSPVKILTTTVVYSTRLFSEGGNFTPQEIEVFQSHLERMDKRIDSAEGAMMQDMEEQESKCLEQVDIVDYCDHTLNNYFDRNSL